MLVPEALACLEIAEQFAEGEVGQAERRIARDRAFHAPWHNNRQFVHRRGPAKSCVTEALARQAYQGALRADFLARHIGMLGDCDGIAGMEEQKVFHARLIREIFGDPFQTMCLDVASLTTPVVNLARTIYQERAFERMPELATALDQSGCQLSEILIHCRGPSAHVRGCWALDLILRKN